MKDFTKTQEKQEKQHLKCNVCGVTALAFGMAVGDTCRKPVEGAAGSGDSFLCPGKLSSVSSKSVDAKQRRSDGAA